MPNGNVRPNGLALNEEEMRLIAQDRLNRDVPDVEDFDDPFNEEDIEERDADLESVKFVSKKAGDIIKSKRKFGVEFEVNLGRNGQNELRGMLANEFGLVHDGSVNNGIEVVSPILGGASGEKQIIESCKALNSVKAGADESCGMHVHLDAKDFFERESNPVLTLTQAMKLAVSQGGDKLRFSVLHSSVMKDLKGTADGLLERIFNKRSLDAFAFSAWQTYANSLSAQPVIFSGESLIPSKRFYLVAPRGSRGSRIPVNEEVKDKNQVSKYRGEPCLAVIGWNTVGLIDPKTSSEDLVIVSNQDEVNEARDKVNRLKRVASFYVAFDDIIASMLPCDRRDNDFSKRINVRMSIGDISRCTSVLDFFNMWTKTHSLESFRDSLEEPRHESRYQGINFRALLKHGTIEIRYHAGTTNAEKTLHWVALHQRILDLASDLNNPRFNVDRIEKAAMIINPEAKTNLFFKKLGLEESTEKYLLSRIAKFEQEDNKFVDSLMADDN
jgi:hypothetical protein